MQITNTTTVNKKTKKWRCIPTYIECRRNKKERNQFIKIAKGKPKICRHHQSFWLRYFVRCVVVRYTEPRNWIKDEEKTKITVKKHNTKYNWKQAKKSLKEKIYSRWSSSSSLSFVFCGYLFLWKSEESSEDGFEKS